MKRIGWWLCFITLFSGSTHCFAFAAEGHRQVCLLAYQLSNPATQQKIDALLQVAPVQDFAQGCVWPDEARKEVRYAYTKPHHFINVPRSATQLKASDCARSGCLLSALAHHAAILQNSQDAKTKAISLLFYSHFIADLHQPLHVSYQDDLGGNQALLRFKQQQSNLHAVWDGALLTELGYGRGTQAIDRFAMLRANEKTLAKMPIASTSTMLSVGTLQWGQQSLDITRDIYRHYQSGKIYSDDAIKADSQIIERRLLEAAVRLAISLDQLLQ